MQTTKSAPRPYAELDNSFGSFNTLKNTVSVGTGLINNAFSFNGRLSRIRSEGFVDRASSRLHSFFINGTYQGKQDLLSFNVFSGKEKTYQAWNGIPQRSEEHTSELQSLMRHSYAVFCLKKKN